MRGRHRPELICRQPPGAAPWEIVLTADEDPSPDAVEQNGKPLKMITRGDWRLSTFGGELAISFGNGDSIDVPLFDGSPLIFKLSNDWTGDGRRVWTLTRGHFIVIAPSEWTREGHVPVAPEVCTDSNFIAHFFFRDGNEPREEVGGFVGHEIVTSGAGLDLTGERVFDDSCEGDLFIGEPPSLKPSQAVVWARVGEERKNGWSGENFKPAKTELADVLAGRQGRFFVRVYDAQARLLDSGQFRYLRALRQIMVNGAPYTPETLLQPPPPGHPPTKVRFVGAAGAALTPILPSAASLAAEIKGAVVVGAATDADDLSCALETDGGTVNTILELPRVWWRLKHAGQGAEEPWRDREITMTREEFREAADRNAVVELRVPKRVGSALVGFGDGADRVYPSKRNPGRKRDDAHRRATIEVPLADFGDYTQIDQWLADDAQFSVRFDLSGTEARPETLSLVRVQADSRPEIVRFKSGEQAVAAGDPVTLCWTTRNAERVRVVLEPGIGRVETNGEHQITPSQTTTFTLSLKASGMDDVSKRLTVKVHPSRSEVGNLTARVQRAPSGWRVGRGFSRDELRAAGLTTPEARRRSFPVDERRRSSHRINVEALEELMNA